MEQNQGRLTYAQQREELGREFGTKKAKKAIASRSENAITSDAKGKGAITDVQTAILESVGEATSNLASKLSEKDKANAALAAKPIPRPNLDAESPEDVYTFDTLIPPSDARLIKVKEWMEQDRDTLGLMHSYPHDRHPAAASYGDSRRMQALRYLTLLLEFHDALGNAGKSTRKVPKKELLQKKLPPSRWAPELVDSVRRRFTNDSGQELGKWQTDNLYTHICALALYIDHWECEMFMLKDDLKLEIRQISQYFSELGARVNAPTEAERNRRNFSKAQANATRIAKLKLPLDFPKVRMARRV
jgi:DNA-directed RNA polymerase I subunit RPA49